MAVTLVEKYSPEWPKRFEEIKALLAERGYYHEGDKGIQDREAFKIEDDSLRNSLPAHHLYVCPRYGAELEKQTAFRDFLKKNKKYAKRLSELKWSLVERYNNDREAYMEGKAALCREITEKALDRLQTHNKI